MFMTGAIYRRWLHSFEEDADGVVVYRPEDFGFPAAARPRAMLELRADGCFVQHLAARSQAPQAHEGRWSATPDGQLTLAYTVPARRPSRFALVQADEQVLRLRGSP